MVILSQDAKNAIINDIDDTCRRIRRMSAEEMLSFISSERYLGSQAALYCEALKDIGVDPVGKRILEIGSGYGFFLVHASKALGWGISGVEPGEGEFHGRVKIAQGILSDNGVSPDRIVGVRGEHTGLDSGGYDIVVSNDVLEHVGDPGAVLNEALRLLKPGGVMIFNVPNYRWFYEGHYNLFWLPILTKNMAKRYVGFFGRDPFFLEHIHFLTPGKLNRLVYGLSGAEFLRPLHYKTAQFMADRVGAYVQCRKSSAGRVGPVVHVLNGLISTRFVRSLLEIFASMTGCYHEMHLVLRKAGA